MEMREKGMPVFDDVFGMISLCTENFRGGVRDSFGASIITDVLEPILMEIDSLRSFNEEFKRHAFNIDQVLEEARAIQLKAFGGAL
jgi:hypothetical protein